jgi:hypothetical protein
VLAFTFGLLFWRQRQSIFANPGIVIGAAMELFVMSTAQVFGFAVKELCAIAAMVGNVVDNIGGGNETELEAPRA